MRRRFWRRAAPLFLLAAVLLAGLRGQGRFDLGEN